MTDEELVLKVRAGDKEAFGELMERYTKKLTRYGERFLSRREHIEDIVQDVFIKTYENLQSFDATRRFSPWIYRIAHNAFVNALRKQSREAPPRLDFDVLLSHHVVEDREEEMKEEEEMRVLLEKGINDLKPIYREVVTLYYFDGFDYREIADILEVPVGTVGVRLRRAKEELRRHLEKNG